VKGRNNNLKYYNSDFGQIPFKPGFINNVNKEIGIFGVLLDLLEQGHQATIALEALDGFNFFGRQFKVEDLEVGLDATLGNRLGDDNVGTLNLVTNEDLSRSLVLLGSNILNLQI